MNRVVRRKLEVYKLTISGLKQGTDYGEFLASVRETANTVAKATFKVGAKQHCLHSIEWDRKIGAWRMRFFSFAAGYRPDIVNMEDYRIRPTPLSPDETTVDWTHVMAIPRKSSRYRLIIERTQPGIWPQTIADYLEELVRTFGANKEAITSKGLRDIDISIEAEPAPEFASRLDKLQKVKSVLIRIVRPNPGWGDLESELSSEADASEAQKLELKLQAKKRGSLARKSGVVSQVSRLAHSGDLDYAKVEGTENGKPVSFSTDKMAIQSSEKLNIDSDGQVDPEIAFEKMADFMQRLP